MNETELNRQMQENMQISVKFCFLFSGLYKYYFLYDKYFCILYLKTVIFLQMKNF